MSNVQRVLIIFAKAPVPGEVKTRLASAIGLDAAAHLYRCLLLDTLHAVRQVPDITLAIAYTPPSAAATFYELAPDCVLVSQVGVTLNERLDHALTHFLHSGYDQAAVLGSDIPLVDPHVIAQGFMSLDGSADVALGPGQDGGYYFLAVCTPQPQLFQDIQMSTPTVATETIAAAECAGLQVVLLPSTYDIDTPLDVKRLQADLQSRPDHVAQHTRTWFNTSGV